MKRHVALRTLSTEHHHGLVHARRLTRAADGAPLDAAAAGYLRFVDDEMCGHMRDEEELLLPEYARWDEEHGPLTARVLADHLRLRMLTLELRRASLDGEPAAPIARELGELLSDHIRFEERELFPRIERTLPCERLAGVGVLLARSVPEVD